MTYKRFEDLPVWLTAADLYDATEDLLENESFHASRGFRDQLDRAALSVSNNIAEGFERGTTNELLAFIYIARGSAGEARSMVCLKKRRAHKAGWPAESQIANFRFEIPGRVVLAPVARLGGLTAKFGDQRPATFERQIAPGGRSKETRGRLSEGTAAEAAAWPSVAQRCGGARLDLKSQNLKIRNLKN